MVSAGHWIGADLGGTRVRAVLSDEKGNFLEKTVQQVDKRSARSISRQIARLACHLCEKHRVDTKTIKGIGIASAGPLSMQKGELVHPPNLPFDRVPLTKPITEELNLPTCLINDCAGAALGERAFGAAKGLDNFVYITISTGIGAGVIENGTLLLGKDGNGHEVGHFVIDCAGKLVCGCGRRGHWEAYCSGRNIPNYVRMRLKDAPEKTLRESFLFKRVGGDFSKLAAADLFAAARQGDDLSLELVGDIGVLNAMGFASVINAYDPSLITVGGTVVLKNKKIVLSPIKKHVGDYSINRVPKIAVTPLGSDVVLFGAVATAIEYAK